MLHDHGFVSADPHRGSRLVLLDLDPARLLTTSRPQQTEQQRNRHGHSIVIPRMRPTTFDSDRLRGCSPNGSSCPASSSSTRRPSRSPASKHRSCTASRAPAWAASPRPSTRPAASPPTPATDGKHTRKVARPGPCGRSRRTSCVDAIRPRDDPHRVRARARCTHRSRAVTEGVRFDGKERVRFAVKADVRARVTLNGVTVSGPRAGLSASFTDGDAPLRLLAATWDAARGVRRAATDRQGRGDRRLAGDRSGAVRQARRPRRGRRGDARLLGGGVRRRRRSAGAVVVPLAVRWPRGRRAGRSPLRGGGRSGAAATGRVVRPPSPR